jgi:ABC-type lipoprotein release transport system permease subunit
VLYYLYILRKENNMKEFRAVMATPFLVLGVLFMTLGMSVRFGFKKATYWVDESIRLVEVIKGE